MKWKGLTPDQLVKVSSDLDDRAHDMEIEREFIAEEHGFDLVAALECVARRLRREAKRRERVDASPSTGEGSGETCAECGNAIRLAEPEDDLAPGAYVHRTGDDSLDCDLGGGHDARPMKGVAP